MAKRIDTVTITIDAQAARAEMEKMKQRSKELGQSIAEMKRQLEDPGLQKTSAQWKQINKEYKEAKREQKELNHLIDQGEQSLAGMNSVLDNLSKATYNDLIKKQRTLSREIKNAKPGTKEYKELERSLRRVNQRVNEMKNSWNGHESQLKSVARRLASYVAIYGGFNFILGKIRQSLQGILKLSDSLADIQKTTGLAGTSLQNLSKDIDAIDTRTSQEELHKLAATAGQMGITARDEVLGFVKASNQLNVALRELGDEGVLSLAKIAQLSGDSKRMGIEKSLLSIGSAINELSANSAASAGPIADFMRRVGGMAPIAKLATSDLAALGATADALGQPIEVAGTAMNKFIMSLVSNTEDIAYALNLDIDLMKGLINNGNTIEAVVMVLDKVKSAGEEGGAALKGIFKDLGSDGARMTQVISAMAQNTEFLREQVELSSKAFYEATSATREYNVKNENAAAIAARIANYWREFFVNSDSTTWLTGVLNKLLELSKFLTGASNKLALLKTAVATALVVFASLKLGLNSLGQSFAYLIGWMKSTNIALLGHVRTLIVAEKGTMAYKRALVSLKTTIKTFAAANWFTLIAAAITSIVVLVRNWNKEQKLLRAHIEELTSALAEEKRAIEDVNDELKKVQNIKDANDEAQARVNLIKKINNEYGTYLEYQLSEAAGYEEIAAALKLVNEQLDLKYAKQIYDKRMEKATETYTSNTEKIGDSIINRLSKMPEVGNKAFSKYQDLLALVKELADTANGEELTFNVLSDEWEKVRKILPHIREYRGAEDRNIAYFYASFAQSLQKLYNEEVAYRKARNLAMAEQNANVIKEEEDVVNAQAELVTSYRARMEELIKKSTEGMTEDEVRKHYETILDYGNKLIAEAEAKYAARKIELDQQRREAESNPFGLRSTPDNPVGFDYEAELKKARGPVEELKNLLQPIMQAYEGDAWGKALNIPGLEKAFGNLQNINTASVDNLVQTFKTLEEAGKKYTSVEVFNKIFNQDAKTIDEMLAYYKAAAEKVKNRLAELGYTTSGKFDWSSEAGRNAAKNGLQKEFEAAKSALKAYYEEQETIIKQAYLNREITHGEMTRRISNNEQEQSKAFVDLYNVLLGEAKKYGTNIEEILKGKDLQKLGGFLRKLGPAMVDGLKKGRAESEGAIRDEAIEMRKIIEKAMLEGDVFGKLERDFRETLDELSLLASDFGRSFQAVDANMADGLVKELMMLSDKAYEVDERGLKNQALLNTKYADWWFQVEGDQLTLLLEKLREYYDNRLDVQRKYIQKAQREWQQQYKQSGGEAGYKQSKQSAEMAYKQGMQSAERDYEQGMQIVAREQGRQSAMSTLGSIKSAGDYNSERGVIVAEAALEVEKITKTAQLEVEKISSTAEREAQKIDSNITFLRDRLTARALEINETIAGIIESETLLLASLDPNSEEYAAKMARINELKNAAVSRALSSGDAESVALSGEIDTQTESRKSIETQATLDANAIIVQSELDTNAIIQQSAQETTESVLEQWKQRADALSGWAEMVGNTMGEVWMLEKRANDARARGDEETAKKLESQAKESRQNLVKEALNKAIDLAKVWAMELGFKIMYNAMAQKSDEQAAIAGTKLTLMDSIASILANGFKGAGKEIGSKGWAGLITGAIVIAAAAGLAAAAKSAVNNMFPEATEGVSDASTNPKRKLTTGMLTYAEGKYPVLGNDGVVYDAQYTGSGMKTGVYRKPHFGIFAEKQPEMVIDGKTTQRLVLNYPEIYSGILELSRTGRMGMRTYATGNVLEIGEGYDTQAHQAQQQMQMEEMRQTMAATAAALAALTRRLDQPINASVNYFGKGGQREAEQRGSRWAARNRVK